MNEIRILHREITCCDDCLLNCWDSTNECDYCAETDSTIEDDTKILHDCPLRVKSNIPDSERLKEIRARVESSNRFPEAPTVIGDIKHLLTLYDNTVEISAEAIKQLETELRDEKIYSADQNQMACDFGALSAQRSSQLKQLETEHSEALACLATKLGIEYEQKIAKLKAHVEELENSETNLVLLLVNIRAQASKGQRQHHWLSDVLDDIFRDADRELKLRAQAKEAEDE